MPNWCYSNIDVEDINKSGAVAKIKAFFDDMRKHIVELMGKKSRAAAVSAIIMSTATAFFTLIRKPLGFL